ncbi:glyoxalase/bleomycin resistance protein/dioxygenase superfamily protein [Kribbella steppae]|uniref:Glyoxalase/bleomycin resistance protein/dioxygenase superfamily protein n=1 Tax=Kribbella steppae TaxID=2512223 RepID=A0A4R2HMW3_9ACTN|nr:VOC family protein [Kribbella steppae]TCO30464.1 glyoxalase/bleomycin resistance protein/dioxygenase superfamily protein [Kribbella steppae]
MPGSTGGVLVHINPILNVSDLQASITFYTEVLDFELLDTFGDPADFAIIRWDQEEIYLCENGQGQPGTWLALFVSEPAALYEHLVINDAKILMPYAADGGEFRVADPDGHVLRVFSGAPEE